MDGARTQRRGVLGMFASLVIVFVGLKLAAPVVVPVLLALTIALAVRPLARWLRQKRMPLMLTTIVSVVLVFALLVAIFALFVYAGRELGDAVPRLQRSATELRTGAINWLLLHEMPTLAESLGSMDVHERALGTALDAVRGVASLITTMLAVFVFTIFMIVEGASAEEKLQLLSEGTGRSRAEWLRALYDMQRYLVVKTVMSGLTGLVVFIWTAVWGVENALLWGVLAFVLNFVPVIGSIVAGIPAVLLALVDLGFVNASIIALGYVAINASISNFLEPKIMGRALGSGSRGTGTIIYPHRSTSTHSAEL